MSKKTLQKNIEHCCNNVSQKIAFALVIAVIFNTFTSAFLLFTINQREKNSQQTNILKESAFLQPVAGSLAFANTSKTKKNVVKQPNIQNTALSFQTPKLEVSATDVKKFSSLSAMAGPVLEVANIESLISELEGLKVVYDSSSKKSRAEQEILRALRNLIQKLTTTITSIQEILDSCESGGTCPQTEGAVEFLTELQNSLTELKNNLAQAQKDITAAFDAIEQALSDIKTARIDLQDSLTAALQSTLLQLEVSFTDNTVYMTSNPSSQETTYGTLSHLKEELDALVAAHPKLEDLPELLESLADLLELFGIDADALVKVSDPRSFILDLQTRIENGYQAQMNTIALSLEAAGALPQFDTQDGSIWLESFITALKNSATTLGGINVPAQSLQELLPDLTLLVSALGVLDQIINAFLGAGASQLTDDVIRLGQDIITYTATTTMILKFYEDMGICVEVFDNPESCGTNDPLCLKTFGNCLSTRFLGFTLDEITATLQACTPQEGLTACLQENPRTCVEGIVACVVEELRG